MTRSNKHKNKHKNKHMTKIILLVLAAVILIVAGGYTYRSTYYADRFLPNTTIEQIDISNKTIDEANKILHDRYTTQEFTIKDGDNEWKKINLAQFGLQTDFTKELTTLKDKQNQWSWGMAYVSAAEDQHLEDRQVDQEKLNQEIAGLKGELDALNTDRTQTQNASLAKGETGFSITPEIVGNAIDTEKAALDIANGITSGENTIDLTNYQTKPTVTKEDATLQKEMNELNKIAQVAGNYVINGNTIQIPTANIMDWLSYQDGQTTIDQEKVRAYVADIGAQYNTSTNPSAFNSTRRGEVQVPAGTLSWTIQTDDETVALIEALKAGEDFTRTPITAGSAGAANPLFGNTYVEVDLVNQHMWYYKDGALVLETDIVSGKPSTPTPTGVFYIWNKKENETLRGKNDDGTDYASPVNYWLPIDWGGVGIHDSDWQPAYGGELWKTRGSHGCVNTPPGVMKELYQKVETGTPVIVC